MDEKKIKYWSTKKLIQEIKDINWHIENYSYGRWELYYRELLYKVLNKREEQ